MDADTDTENDRHAYHPQGRPRTPNPHRSLSNRASSTRLFVPPDAHARRILERKRQRPAPWPEGVFPTQAISLNPPRDAEVGGWASRDRRGSARADDARRQPLGRKKRGIRVSNHPYSPLPNQRSPRDPHACIANGDIERGYPPVLPLASRGALVGATPLLVTGTRALAGAPPRPTRAAVTVKLD